MFSHYTLVENKSEEQKLQESSKDFLSFEPPGKNPGDMPAAPKAELERRLLWGKRATKGRSYCCQDLNKM